MESLARTVLDLGDLLFPNSSECSPWHTKMHLIIDQNNIAIIYFIENEIKLLIIF